ncbi:hypothetical protein AB1K62_03045 [Parasphingorhabdus sp. JC815]|uniref:hypothetical protein n=1 Tax=Parasphingorhabdus sp. JC815 TaxID=3232140 RepID=UPI00345A4CA6
MTATLDYSGYKFKGYDELCLRAGTGHQQTILFIPPLFDEMNRMRRMIVDVMRLLDKGGVGSILPDLPGTNESIFPQEGANLTIWKEALLSCSLTDKRYVASFRGGCLLDNFADESCNQIVEKWRFAPAKGSSLLRTMMRTRIASDKEAGVVTNMTNLSAEAERGNVNLAGNAIGSAMFAELKTAIPAQSTNIRTVQLANNSQAADAKLPGSALWLRAEPDDDTILSAAIADDILAWVAV